MKSLILFLVLVCFSQTAFSSLGLELVPKGRPFRLTFVDPREIRMALAFQGNSKINAVIGNYFSLFGIRSDEGSDWYFHFGLEGAGFFTMRESDHRFPLETADGLIGFYTETNSGRFQYQFRFTHISAHLADGSSGESFPFSRETASFRIGFLLNTDTQFYSGLHYLVNTVPKVPRLAFQLGATSFFPISGSKIIPFGGFDLKHKGDVAVNPSLNMQLGIAFGNPSEAYKSFRFFYAYFSGADPRGQYFEQSVTSHSMGIEMQI
jgi:hypothetical protein